MPKYYEISEAAAKRAKDMNSYSDYAPGSATAGYQQMVDEAYALAEKQKAQVDPMLMTSKGILQTGQDLLFLA